MNGKLYLMMGTPGAGKSTFLRDHVKGNTSTIVSRDVIRFRMVEEGEPYFSKEDEVFKEFINQIDYFISHGIDVYADATHLNKRSRAKTLNNISAEPREVAVIWLRTPLNECIKNNNNREGTRAFVPLSQIRRMAYSLQAPDFDEDINEIYIYEPGKQPQVIRPFDNLKEKQ